MTFTFVTQMKEEQCGWSRKGQEGGRGVTYPPRKGGQEKRARESQAGGEPSRETAMSCLRWDTRASFYLVYKQPSLLEVSGSGDD